MEGVRLSLFLCGKSLHAHRGHYRTVWKLVQCMQHVWVTQSFSGPRDSPSGADRLVHRGAAGKSIAQGLGALSSSPDGGALLLKP